MSAELRKPVLTAHGIGYKVGDRELFHDIDLLVEEGQSLAITGPSGSGKTTLLMCLAGILRPSSGDILLGNQDLKRLNASRLAALRLNEIGTIYQFGELIPELTPLENVCLPALLARVPKAQAYARGIHLLTQLGVESLAEVRTATLSGGERQRIATARALINQPSLLLADEPTGALDQDALAVVADLLFELPKERGCALVVVTHNEQVAARADKTVSLEAGVLAETHR